MTDPIISHGRGGAANIRPDSQPYADGEITREGPVGDQGDGAYSAGRGGFGNINSPGLKPSNASNAPGDKDVVPETAVRAPGTGTWTGAGYENFHVGRGGEGNVHREQQGAQQGQRASSDGGDTAAGSGGGGKGEGLKERILHPFGEGRRS